MRYILSKSCVDILTQFALSRVLLAFDFDGTLAPIVTEHAEAKMRTRTRSLFRRICEVYPCAVISGRSRDDVLERVGDAQLVQVVGNHGLEPGMSLEDFEREVAQLKPHLSAALTGIQGVEIEDKRYSLAIHYRKSRSKKRARQLIGDAVTRHAHRMRRIDGKAVVNILPLHSPHKGDALLRLRQQTSTDTALYVGDDVTDEDIFELDSPGRLLTVRVGNSRSSSAGYYLRDQREIDGFLALLLQLRSNVRVQ